MFYLFYLSFIALDPALCSGQENPCIKALTESLKDLEMKKESQGWLSKLANKVAFDGKNGQAGTGVVDQEGKVYIAQTVEVKDKDGKLLRRITDCMRGDKKL